ncbi:hypothetical protein Aperf_G00000099070 [Anoplocephala perfoliata]
MSAPPSRAHSSAPNRGSERSRSTPRSRSVGDKNTSERLEERKIDNRGRGFEIRAKLKSNYDEIFKLACELAGMENECETNRLTRLDKLTFCHEVLKAFGEILKDRADLQPIYKELFTKMCAENGIFFKECYDSRSLTMTLDSNTGDDPAQQSPDQRD